MEWFPVGAAQAAPNLGKAYLVSIGVLDNELFQPLRAPRDDAESNRAAVVLKVKTARAEPGPFQKGLEIPLQNKKSS
jgi:hypothetical protein